MAALRTPDGDRYELRFEPVAVALDEDTWRGVRRQYWGSFPTYLAPMVTATAATESEADEGEPASAQPLAPLFREHPTAESAACLK